MSEIGGQIKGGSDQRAEDRRQGATINPRIIEAERKRDFNLNEFDRFRYRTRYFIDSGIIGSKEFVDRVYQQFKHCLFPQKGKRPKTIKGLDGLPAVGFASCEPGGRARPPCEPPLRYRTYSGPRYAI